jgi:hypothetical protein
LMINELGECLNLLKNNFYKESCLWAHV